VIEQLRTFLDENQDVYVFVELVVLVIGTWVALRLVQPAVDGFIAGLMDRQEAEDTGARLTIAESRKRRRTLQILAGNLLRFGVLLVATIIGLGILHVDLGPAIAGLGLVGLGIGLGFQSLVRDLVAGTFIIVENQFATGDVVKVAGVTGTVEDLGLRRTVLRDFDGTVHVVPNGQITVASNQTRVWARIIVDIPVSSPEEMERARSSIEQAATELAADPAWKSRFLDAPRVVGVTAVGASGITLEATATVVATERDAAAAELRRRVVVAFAHRGIGFGG